MDANLKHRHFHKVHVIFDILFKFKNVTVRGYVVPLRVLSEIGTG